MSKATDKAKAVILQPHEVRHALQHGEVVVVVPAKLPATAIVHTEQVGAPPNVTVLFAAWKSVHSPKFYLTCPLGVKGTRVWVKERWNIADPDGDDALPTDVYGPFAPFKGVDGKRTIHWRAIYQATSANEHPKYGTARWKSARTMPIWASRLTLTLSSVRVCQAQKVTEEEAMAAGFEQHLCAAEDTASCKPGTLERALAERLEGGYLTAKFAFQMHFNKQHPGAWDRNDWAFICHLTAAGNNQ